MLLIRPIFLSDLKLNLLEFGAELFSFIFQKSCGVHEITICSQQTPSTAVKRPIDKKTVHSIIISDRVNSMQDRVIIYCVHVENILNYV